MSTGRDWWEWHNPYDDPSSRLAHRLSAVQHRIREALDAVPAGVIRVVSMCAGQGRDLIGALEGHPRRGDVAALLVELDARNVASARTRADEAGLAGISVVEGDASATDAYVGAVPAEVVLVCGVFGNVSDADIRRTIAALPMFCAAGASVIWTRHRAAPDLTPSIRTWFAESEFAEVGFDAPADATFGVGSHRFTGEPADLRLGLRLFTFQS